MLFGFSALALGIVGIILPVLPTTPLLLLALFCFTKGSSKIANWFVGTKLYKKHLKKYVANKGLTKKQKIFIQVFASVMMAISFVLLDWWLFKVLLFFAFLIHNYVFIFKIKTIKKDKD